MAVAYREIATILDGARRRQGGIVLATALGWGASAVLALLLAGAALLAYRPDLFVVRALAVGLAFVAAAAAVAWAGIALRRRAGAPESVARALGEREPSIRSDLVSAVELERDSAEIAASRRFSPALLEEHVARTAARARGLDLRRLVRSQPARRALAALAAVALLNAVALAVGGRGLATGYARLVGAAPVRALPPVTPITGDVELTFRYPAYMNRPERTLSGTGGEIQAPKGTLVVLKTRADRDVGEAQLLYGEKALSLTVKPPRELAGQFLVEEGGSYRFRFTRGQKVLAEGPPAAIVVEPDAFPEVRITAPKAQVEVQPGARVQVEWSASDDWGLRDLSLVTKRDGSAETRVKLRDLAGARREGGTETLDSAALHLAEGDQLLYWLEATDEDTVSGPKRGASATQVLKIYSAAEHRRLAIEKVRAIWEALVLHLGEELETEPRLAPALEAKLHEVIQKTADGAVELRRDRSAPKELAAALDNVASGLRRVPRTPRTAVVAELEKDVLYLEQLLDQERADDLVRMAKELAQRRRDLAALAERVRDAPSEEGKRQLLAEVRAMKQRMQDLQRRMAELAKGLSDEHMNREAVAELARSKDAQGGLDAVEEALAKGDLDQAMKALDQLGAQMDELVAGMERTAKRPGEENRELSRELSGLKRDLDGVEAEQRQLAADTEQEKARYQKEVAKRLAAAGDQAAKLQKLVGEAKKRVEEARPGVSLRTETEWEAARDRLAELERAIAAKDLDAARESAKRALTPVQRLAAGIDEDQAMAERYPRLGGQDPAALRAAREAAARAVPPTRTVKEELEKLFPDPKSVLPKESQARMEQQGRRQEELARKTGELGRKMAKLGEKAPVFPPEAGESMQEAREQMQGAAGELGRGDPQRGHGRQRQALDALGKLRAGMEQMAQKAQGNGQGEGMPMPFAQSSGGREDGDGQEPSQEKVEIPGAEAYKPPEAFRKDLMDAMKQGAPEKYKGEVSRYYQEIVK